MEHKNDNYIACDWCFWYSYQSIIKGTGGLRNEDEWRPSKLLHYRKWEESWRLEEACCHLNSSERPSANVDVKTSQGVDNNNHRKGSPNLGQKTRPYIINKKTKKQKRKKKEKRTFKIVDFAVPADHWIKLRKSEKNNKYLNLARKLKKLRNMKGTIIPIVIGAFGTVTKWLLKGLEDLEVGGRGETIQTTTLLRTARILGRVLETWGYLLSLRLQWKTIY